MDTSSRIRMYAFLSRIFAGTLSKSEIEELKENKKLLQEIGRESLEWFAAHETDSLYELLREDFMALFDGSDKPVESFVLHGNTDILVGLQNPVMAFYYQNGFEMNFSSSTIKIPDHITIELGFMQLLVQNENLKLQKEFLRTHLGFWAPPYLLGIKGSAKTPFYREMCDFGAEYVVAEMAALGV